MSREYTMPMPDAHNAFMALARKLSDKLSDELSDEVNANRENALAIYLQELFASGDLQMVQTQCREKYAFTYMPYRGVESLRRQL